MKIKIVSGLNPMDGHVFIDGQELTKYVQSWHVSADSQRPHEPTTLVLVLVPEEIEIEAEVDSLVSRLISETTKQE